MWIVAFSLIILMVYLVQFAALSAVRAMDDTVHLLYTFDPGFTIAGFFVMVMYLSIIAALVALISTLLRKFKLYAVIAFGIVLVMVIARPLMALEVLRAAFGFLLFEPSLLFFFIKGIVFWVLLASLSLFVNWKTVYYQQSIRRSGRVIAGIVATCSCAALIAAVSIPPFEVSASTSQGDGFSFEFEPMVFDISHLPEGSSIEIEASGSIAVLGDLESQNWSSYTENGKTTYFLEDGTTQEVPEGYLVVDSWVALVDIDSNKLNVSFVPPIRVFGSIELENPTNARLEARLEGATLFLEYHFDNTKIVLLPIWSFMWQFDHFVGKEIFPELLFPFEQTWGDSVHIWVE